MLHLQHHFDVRWMSCHGLKPFKHLKMKKVAEEMIVFILSIGKLVARLSSDSMLKHGANENSAHCFVRLLRAHSSCIIAMISLAQA